MVLQTLDSLGPLHGYAIAARLEQVSTGALQLNMGTLYPALMRLEQRGLLRGTWGTTDTNRKARFYALTPAGTPPAREGETGLGPHGGHHAHAAARRRRERGGQAMRTLREWMQRVLGSLKRGRRDGDLEDELRLHLELAADEARRRGETRRGRASAWRRHLSGDGRAARSARPALVRCARRRRRLRLASAAPAPRREPSPPCCRSDWPSAQRPPRSGSWTACCFGRCRSPNPIACSSSPGRSSTRRTVRTTRTTSTIRRSAGTAAILAGHADAMVVGMTAPQEVDVRREQRTRDDSIGSTSPAMSFRPLVLQPALGRLLAPSDDVTPGAHPVAVISYDYWTRRFGRSPDVIGRTFNRRARSGTRSSASARRASPALNRDESPTSSSRRR